VSRPRRIAAELLADARSTLGEGPLWDAAHARILWVDIVEGRLNDTRLDGSTETILRVDAPVGAVALRSSGGLVLVAGDGISTCRDDGSGVSEVAHVTMRPGERWNDAKVDPGGRFVAGTLTEQFHDGVTKTYPHEGSRLVRLDPDLSLNPVLDVTLSNGLGWTADGRTFYYVDTMTGRIDAFDYQPAAGEIANRRPLVHVDESDGFPDGLAVDEEGGIWVALWGGRSVRRYLPDGTVDAMIELPVTNVTSCAFIGPELDRLVITSAREELTPQQLDAEPHAGSLFIAEPGVRGVPVAAFGG
jgi:sugar lactone lactonase YvrE